MHTPCVALGLLFLVWGGGAAAAPPAGDPSPGNVAAPSSASTPAKPRPTSAELDQPGAIAVASPNQRVTGTTFASPDPAIFGRLNLHALAKPFEQPPAPQATPGDAAKVGSGNAIAPPPALNP